MIAFLIEHFQDFEACPPGDDLGELLEEVGFDDEDIGDVLQLVDMLRKSFLPTQHLLASTAIRVYSTEELSILSREVCALLHFLEKNLAINPAQREFVIHSLLMLPEYKVTEDMVKVLSLLVLWAHKSELPVLIGDELMAVLNGHATMY